MSTIVPLQKLDQINDFFFNTPLVEFDVRINGQNKKLYAKYEAFNFSGSIKDRMAYFIFKNAYQNKELQPNQPILEVTSGNTGIALTSLARYLGHEITIIIPDWLSQERYAILALNGAKLIKISQEQGGFLSALEMAKSLCAKGDFYYPDQFSNQYNKLSHEQSTAPELAMQLKNLGLSLNHFVAGVGTGGTVMGVNEYCQKNHLNCQCHPLEPANSPTLSTGGKKIGSHRIQGIADDFIPDLLKLDQLAGIVSVDDGESIALARVINKMGLSIGISGGANLLGALKLLEKHPNDVVATTLADSAFKYLTTDLCKESSDNVTLDHYPFEIVGYRVHRL